MIVAGAENARRIAGRATQHKLVAPVAIEIARRQSGAAGILAKGQQRLRRQFVNRGLPLSRGEADTDGGFREARCAGGTIGRQPGSGRRG